MIEPDLQQQSGETFTRGQGLYADSESANIFPGIATLIAIFKKLFCVSATYDDILLIS